jgi:hypothetical protein
MNWRKTNNEYLVPVGIYADEAGHWVSDFDCSFAQRCRSASGYLAYTAQSVNSLINAFGGGDVGTKAFEDLVANLQIRVGHANLCPATNKFFSDSLGRHKVERSSISMSGDANSRGQRRRSKSVNTSIVEEDVLPAIAFTGLLTHGEDTAAPLEAEAIFIIGGRQFKHNKKRYLKVRIRRSERISRSETWLLNEPHAVNWANSVSLMDIAKAFLKGWKQGREMFRRWVNFWGDGWIVLRPETAGGNGDAE